MNHTYYSPFKVAVISIIVFLAVLIGLLQPKDDTSLERSSVRNLHQEQAEGCNDKTDEYPYAKKFDGMTIFNFYDFQAYGASDNSEIMAEGVYGIRLQTKGTTVTVTPYRHSESVLAVNNIQYGKVNDAKVTKTTTIPTVTFNENTSFDLARQADGVYCVSAAFKGKSVIHGYVVKEGNTVHTCQMVKGVDIQSVSKSLEIFHKFTDKLNPNDYLSLKGLTYPSAGGSYGYVDDVSAIAQFSKDNFTSSVWNEEMKVYAMVNWLNRNIAYDTWRTKANNDESRAHALGNYTDPSIFCWHNKVGVCWDYTNILTIMCRAQGIPATSIDTKSHTWNIIYLNGRWVSVDVCDTGMYESKTYNGDRNKWTNNTIRTWVYYMTFPKPQRVYAVKSTNDQIWTHNRALR